MKVYLVSTDHTNDLNAPKIKQYAGTQQQSKDFKNEVMIEHSLKRDQVNIEQVEIPTAKGPLLDFVNDLLVSAQLSEQRINPAGDD